MATRPSHVSLCGSDEECVCVRGNQQIVARSFAYTLSEVLARSRPFRLLAARAEPSLLPIAAAGMSAPLSRSLRHARGCSRAQAMHCSAGPDVDARQIFQLSPSRRNITYDDVWCASRALGAPWTAVCGALGVHSGKEDQLTVRTTALPQRGARLPARASPRLCIAWMLIPLCASSGRGARVFARRGFCSQPRDVASLARPTASTMRRFPPDDAPENAPRSSPRLRAMSGVGRPVHSPAPGLTPHGSNVATTRQLQHAAPARLCGAHAQPAARCGP